MAWLARCGELRASSNSVEWEPMSHFLEELDSLGVRPVRAKMAEILKEIQRKDRETMVKVQILEREIELNAREKDLFI
ncbi:hypothetical protein Tco_0349478 [Tanacetum coccineum]